MKLNCRVGLKAAFIAAVICASVMIDSAAVGAFQNGWVFERCGPPGDTVVARPARNFCSMLRVPLSMSESTSGLARKAWKSAFDIGLDLPGSQLLASPFGLPRRRAR